MKTIEDIYKNYANLIKNYVFVITEDMELAEEIMQETFVIAIDQINKFRGDCEISVWLRSIAKKVLYKKTKGDISTSTVSFDDLNIADSKDIEEECISNNDKLKLYEALQKVDADTREVMYLRLTGELTFKEIGKILHKNENWARVTFFRGKKKLSKEELL